MKRKKKIKIREIEVIKRKIEKLDGEYSNIKSSMKKLDKVGIHIKKFYENYLKKSTKKIKCIINKKYLESFNEINDIFKKQLNEFIPIYVLDFKKKKKMSMEIINNKMEKLYKDIDEIGKRDKCVECKICTEHFKFFSRNCSCVSDQYMCLDCIFEYYKSSGEIKKCPFGCEGIMLDFKCPYCIGGKVLGCKWCKKNNEIIKLVQ